MTTVSSNLFQVTIWRSGRGEELDKSILKGLIKSLASVTNQLETADETANQGMYYCVEWGMRLRERYRILFIC